MTDRPKCDICNEHPAKYIVFDPDAPTEVRDGSLGIGHIALFLCKVCVGGALGSMLVAAGMAMLELAR